MTQFHERFLNKHEAGGKEAADALHAGIVAYLQRINIDTENIDIMVRAYANLKGLQTACLRQGKMGQGASIALFAHYFTQRRALFDFVDVGPGKEQADAKIRGLFSSSRHLMFCPLTLERRVCVFLRQ